MLEGIRWFQEDRMRHYAVRAALTSPSLVDDNHGNPIPTVVYQRNLYVDEGHRRLRPDFKVPVFNIYPAAQRPEGRPADFIQDPSPTFDAVWVPRVNVSTWPDYGYMG